MNVINTFRKSKFFQKNSDTAARQVSSRFLLSIHLVVIFTSTLVFQFLGADFFYYLNLSSYFAFSWDFVQTIEPLCFVARWLSAFYLCWFGIPYVGAGLTALLCWSGYILCRKMLNVFTKNLNFKYLILDFRFICSVLFALFLAWLLVRPVNYFNVAFSILAMMGFFILWVKIRSNVWRYALGILFIIAGYLGFGGYVYGLCLMMVFFEMQMRRLYSLSLILITAVIPYFAHEYVYLRLLKDTYLAGLKPDTLFAKPPFKPWQFTETNQLFYRTHVLARNEKWEEIQTEVGEYFDRFDFANQRIEKQNQDLLNYYKLSALLTHSLGEESYTKHLTNPYFSELFPMLFQGGDGTYSFFWNDFFYQLGAIADARFETMASLYEKGMSIRAIERMTACNTILEDTAFAQVYNHWDSRYPFSVCHRTLLAGKKRLLAQSEYLNPPTPDLRIISLQQVAPDNPFALEYVTFCALQYFRQHQFVADHLNEFRKFGYEKLPSYFEEALFAARFSDTTTNMDLFPISERTKNLYSAYISDQSRMNQGLLSLQSFEKKYKHTYWFNFDYIEPQEIQ